LCRYAVASANLADRIGSYVEVHIEQGPVLQELRQPAAAVAGIAGQTRLSVAVHGTQGHAGTVPMAGRKDAVAAAAEMIHYVERRCNQPKAAAADSSTSDEDKAGDSSTSDEDTMLVCTVGEVRVWPGASNVISSNTNFSVDIRSKSDAERDGTVKDVMTAVERMCAARGMTCVVDRTHDASTVLCDDTITAALKRATADVHADISAGVGGAASAAVGDGRGLYLLTLVHVFTPHLSCFM
jgi:allantoate deiminase